MFIKDVEIKGFWGSKIASSDIYKDVTIFIGLNGTGKTTFVNSIAAVLAVDLIQLYNLQFDEIVINLVEPSKKRSRKIKVSNKSQKNVPFNIYEYKIGQKVYTVSTDSRLLRRVSTDKLDQYRQISPEFRREYIELKKEIYSLVEVSQISVYRQVYTESLEGDPRQRNSAVDERLQQLFEQFARYQLKLETQLNERSTKFQQEAIASLLYSEEFDDFKVEKLENISDIDLETQGEKLSRAFRELGIEGKTQQIEKHIDKLKDAIQGLKSSTRDDFKNIKAQDVFALPLVYRTNRIIDLLNKSEEEKNKITEPRQRFFDTLQSFMSNKNFFYDNKTSYLSFYLDGNKNEIFIWRSLSSGEKQLLIQFMEVLLQEGRSVIFIADEPELSLHVIWQEKLLKALRTLNENAQLIVATHSPDIVADFRNNVINMENIISQNV
jgi:predicted ATP-dependent endonuclease of OLD family